jgi:hypothetical protein
MTSGHLSWALGEAHRTELRQQAKRRRHHRATTESRAEALRGTAVGRILVRRR